MYRERATRCQACVLRLLLLLCPAFGFGYAQQLLASGRDSSLDMTNATCTTSNNTTICTVFGDCALASLATSISLGHRMIVLGPANGSYPKLSLASPTYVGAGAKLELWNVELGPINCSARLNFPSIVLSNDSQKPGSLMILNSRVVLDCTSWNMLQGSVCNPGSTLGDVEVYQDAMAVMSFKAGGVQWQNVTVLSTCATSTASPGIPCTVRTETDGSKLLDDMTVLQARRFVNILFLSAGTLLLPPRSPVLITSNVTISGNGNAATALDVNLQVVVFVIGPGGTLTLRSLFILNMSPRQDKYPLGMLTCMMWFVDLNRNNSSSDQLVVVNSTVLVPAPEFEYLQVSLNPTTISNAWTAGPDALFHKPPVVHHNNSALVLEASGSQGVWNMVSVQMLDFAVGVQVKIEWTGLDALLLPEEVPRDLELPLVQILSPQLELLDFPPPAPAGQSSLAPTRMVMTQSVTLNRSSAASMWQPIELTSDAVIVGHPVHPEQAILDLQGLACLPGSPAVTPTSTGYVTIGDPLQATGPMLYLRDLVLVNLQPVLSSNIDPAADSLGYYTAMSNYSSLLWMFNLDRFTDAVNINSTDGPLTNGSLVLDNVTLVVPASEFRVVAQIVANTLRYNINPLAYQLMRQQLVMMEAAAERDGLHILYERVGAVLLDSNSADIGTLTFPVFNWFGISGTRVKLTSEAPAAFTGTLVPVNASLWTVARPPSPMLPPASNTSWPASADASVDTSSSEAWRLGVIIAGSVIGVAVIAGAALWMVKARQAQGNHNNKCESDCEASSLATPHNHGSLDVAMGLGDPAPRVTLPGTGARPGTCPSLCETQPGPLPLKRASTSLSLVKVVDSTPGSVSSNSQRGSPTAGAAGGAARSPFEAVALGLASMAASATPAAALQGQDPALDPDPELGQAQDVPLRAADVPEASARLDTQVLLARIFNSAETAAGCTGVTAGAAAAYRPPLRLPMCGALSSGSDGPPGGLRPTASAIAPTPTGSMLHEIQRQMECLREELGCGCEEAPQWSIQGQLGKGAHGVVYKGTWRGLDVAIKRVIFQVMGDPVADAKRKTTLREAAINGTLDHPNIVTTYTHEMRPLNQMPLGRSTAVQPFADWQLFIIQEFCDGGSLFSAIQQQLFWDAAANQPLLPQVLSLAMDIASGCAYIHSKNIIHGDLKPDNVLLKFNGSPPPSGDSTAPPGPSSMAKIADFGMSVRLMENRTHVSGVHHGTPLYIAPEILQEGRASTAADVYSFGVILWELCFGTCAWDHLARVVGIPRKQGFPAFHPGLFAFDKCNLPAYSRLGQACLSSDPSERPSFVEVLEALQAMAQDLTQDATQPSSDHTAFIPSIAAELRGDSSPQATAAAPVSEQRKEKQNCQGIT